MKWWKKLFGSSAGGESAQAGSGPAGQAAAAGQGVAQYNQGAACFGKGDYQKAESIFRKALSPGDSPAFRKVAVAAAGMCRLRGGKPLTEDVFPPDLRGDKNGCLVALLAINMAALQVQQGRAASARADDSTWYVDVDVSGCNYELRVINFGGNTMGQAFRKDGPGAPLYLPELEQDPAKAHLRKQSDAPILAFLRKNIKAESLEMAQLPATGLATIVTGDESTQWPTAHKVKVIRY